MFDRRSSVAFDLEASFAQPGWRERVAWPASPPEFRKVSRHPLAALISLISGASEPDRSILLLAGPMISFFARQLLDAGFILQRAEEQGLTVSGLGLMGRAMSGDAEMREQLLREWTGWGYEDRSRVMLLRRIGRVASWCGPLRTARAMVSPDALAVSHNSLLIAGARRSRLAIGFHHGGSMLAEARAKVGLARTQAADPLVDQLTAAMVSVPELDTRRKSIMTEFIAPAAASWVTRARSDLSALKGFRFPAPALWSATGGRYPVRALGIEAMRQGLTVRRFEHVGSGCLVADGRGFDMTERAVSTEVEVPTAHLARFAERIRTRSLDRLAKLIPGDGDPDFVFPRVVRAHRRRPRVVYATTILRRHMQYHDGLLADPVYLDWQLRVSEALASMPVESAVKPHPESFYPGGVNPLASVGNLSTEAFEKLIPETDVFIFDFGQTTTFWKGLATSQPVVYLDLGLSEFQPEVRVAIEERTTILPISYDERNCPRLDRDALLDAIMSARPASEGNPFRAWLGGAPA